jgi:hypothetical protein
MKFGFGPMSTEIVEAVHQYSHEHSVELMLIASKNQIDYDGGYVNNWTTEQYVKRVNIFKQTYPNSNVIVCRDHCGPGFKKLKSQECHESQDTILTIKTDIRCGFDLLHIDMCHYNGDIIDKTCKMLEYACKLNPDIQFEIGTDDIEEDINLEKFQKSFAHFLDLKPIYYVANTGSLIRENKQVGHFDKYHTSITHRMLQEYGIGLKEHNADYLSSEQIRKRKGIVDAMNIAPQLGVVQTSTVLNECQKYGIKVDDFVSLVYNDKRWVKWDYGNLVGQPYLSTIVAGHYHYISDEYLKIVDELNNNVNIGNKIRQNIKEVIYHYVSQN